MRKIAAVRHLISFVGAAALAVALSSPIPVAAQSGVPHFDVDTSWPKPLPNNWATGQVGGVCTDAQDNVFIVNRQNLTEKELLAAKQAPPIIGFNPEGTVIASLGTTETVPKSIHGCAIDGEGNIYVAGNLDGIVQKWSRDGKLLMQIGTRGVVDTSDGTVTGRALNSSHTNLFMPSGMAIDPANDDIYIADGYGNSRIAVFNKAGQFLRQWGRQGTKAEAESGVGGAFMQVVHCIALGNDGLVYVCDRQGDRVQVFDKMGAFKKNIFVRNGNEHLPDAWGTAWWIGFSPDREQKYIYLVNGRNEAVNIIDRSTGQVVGSFGRPGHQAGEFDHGHTMAVDSKGNIYVAETDWGERVQKFRVVSK